MRTTPKIFPLADGRTERVFHKQNKFQKTLKENNFCTMVDALKKKQTITSTALRLGTFRLVFSGSFFLYTRNGQWLNRPLRSFDMNSPLETLVREVIRTGDKNTSRVKICTVCEYEHYPFSHCGSSRKAMMKQNTSSVVGFIVVALYNTSNTLYKCCSNEHFKVVQQTVGRKSSLDDS